jgi:hypothetical protein
VDSQERRERLEELEAVLDALTAIGWSPEYWDPVDEENEPFRVTIRLRWDGLKYEEEVL